MKSIIPPEHRDNVLILLITLLAGIVRLFGLTVHSLWLDELQSVVTCAPENSFARINEICTSSADPAPRTFYYLLSLWFRLFGYSDASARLFPALFGIASIPIMYLLGKSLFNRKAGIFAALFSAINYYNIFYSLEIRFYSLLFFFAILSYLFFIRLIERENKRTALAYALSTLALIVLHYFALLVFVTQVLTWLVIKRKDLKQFRQHLFASCSFLVVLIGFIPFVPGLLTTLSMEGSGQAFDGDSFFMITYFNLFFGTNGTVVLTALTCLIIFVYVASQRKLFLEGKHKSHSAFILLTWMLFPLLIAYARTIYSSSALADRYAIVVLPALLLAVAAGAASVKDRLLQAGIVALFILGSLIKLIPSSHFYTKNDKDDFKGVAQKIKSSTPGSTRVSVYSDRNWHLLYYFNQLKIDPISIDVKGVTDGRFITGKSKNVKALEGDSTLQDFWLASAHRSNLDKMRNISSILQSSSLYIKVDSFAGKDAFADHFVRKDWQKGISMYERLNGITLIPGKMSVPENQLMHEKNNYIVAIWGGTIQSQMVHLKKGSYRLYLSCRGTSVRDTFPVLEVSVNSKALGCCTCSKEYNDKMFQFSIASDTLIRVGLNLLNDVSVEQSREDRNVYLRKLFIK